MGGWAKLTWLKYAPYDPGPTEVGVFPMVKWSEDLWARDVKAIPASSHPRSRPALHSLLPQTTQLALPVWAPLPSRLLPSPARRSTVQRRGQPTACSCVLPLLSLSRRIGRCTIASRLSEG
jgi:hypothetical protein